MRRPRLLPILLPIAALTPCLSGCHKDKPPPSIDGLQQSLEQSAEQAISPAPLANEQVILPAQPGMTDAQAADVLKAAVAAGGAGLRSLNAQGQISILATIPDNNAGAFKAALHHQPATMQPPSSSTSLIEVLILPPSPSPTPP